MASDQDPTLTCLHPGCESPLVAHDEIVLEAHMRAHFNDPEVSSIANAVSRSDSAVPRSNSTFGHYPDLVSLIQNSRAPGHNGCPLYACESPDGIRVCPVQRCAWRTESFECHYHRREHLLNFSEEKRSIRAATPHLLLELPPRGTKWNCPAEGCLPLFKRETELIRHMNIHLPGVQPYECSELGCPYKGDKGFYRKDKLVDHQRNRHGLDIPRRHQAPRTPGGRTSATPEEGFGQASGQAPGQAVENAVGQAFSYISEQAPASASGYNWTLQ